MVLFSIMQLSQTVNYPGAGRPGLFAGSDNDMLCWAENEEGRPAGSRADVRRSFKKKKKRPGQLDAPVLPGMAGVIEDTGLATLMGVFRAIMIKTSG